MGHYDTSNQIGSDSELGCVLCGTKPRATGWRVCASHVNHPQARAGYLNIAPPSEISREDMTLLLSIGYDASNLVAEQPVKSTPRAFADALGDLQGRTGTQGPGGRK